jgi:hypothetical protein
MVTTLHRIEKFSTTSKVEQSPKCGSTTDMAPYSGCGVEKQDHPPDVRSGANEYKLKDVQYASISLFFYRSICYTTDYTHLQ